MTINDSDAQLVASHMAGDPAALAGIYDRFADSLHDTAAAMLNNRHDAADATQDVFLIAAEKMAQLRDPERLKPWLFAILRNEVYRRTKNRKRTVVTDFSSDDSGFDMADERQDDVDTEAEGMELAELVRGAARGLDERDQLVLELSVRQGLEGQDLADALGVSTNQSYTLVHRMRDRVERSLGAFCVAKAGRKDCDDLDSILEEWDGEFTVLVRKRVARHIESCETCSESRRKVAPLALFGGAPVLAAPAVLREQVLGAVQMQMAAAGGAAGSAAPTTPYAFTADGGFPRIVKAGRRIAAWIAPTAAASLLLVSAGAGFWWLDANDANESFRSAEVTTTSAPATTAAPTTIEPTTSVAATTVVTSTSTTSTSTTSTTSTIPDTTTTPPPTTPVTTAPPTTQRPAVIPPTTQAPPTTTPPTTQPPAPGQLVGSSSMVNLGGNTPSTVFTLSNPGGLAVAWSLAGSSAPFTVSPQSGVLAPGASAGLTIALDRANLAEGTNLNVTVMINGDTGQSLPLVMAAGVERPPSISGVSVNPFCNSLDLTVGVQATIVDPAGIANATLSLSGPNANSGNTAMTLSGFTGGNVYFGSVLFFFNDVDDVNGSWSWSISATDSRGNTANSSGSFTVAC